MQALITTSHSLLRIDSETERVEVLDRGRGLYYGITSNEEHVYVAARRRSVSSTTPQESERGVILMYDREMRLIREIEPEFALRDIHEIALQGGRLWITCSFDNMIALYDPNATGGRSSQWRRWYPFGSPEQMPTDANHFNSFHFADKMVYVIAHNHGDSELLGFDMQTLVLETRQPLGRQSHNIRKVGDEFIVCSSGDGKIVSSKGLCVEVGGFPRGLWIEPGMRVVGVSEPAERQMRDSTTGELRFYDDKWELRRSITLPNEGLVLDIHGLQ